MKGGGAGHAFFLKKRRANHFCTFSSVVCLSLFAFFWYQQTIDTLRLHREKINTVRDIYSSRKLRYWNKEIHFQNLSLFSLVKYTFESNFFHTACHPRLPSSLDRRGKKIKFCCACARHRLFFTPHMLLKARIYTLIKRFLSFLLLYPFISFILSSVN